MASLPGLVLKIGANTTDAIAGLNKVNRAVGQSASTAARMSATWRKVGPALGAAAAGFGLLAVKMGTDAVQAAIAEQNELVKLNQSLKNMGFEAASEGVTKFIDDLQYTANVSDGDLRPAFARLLRSTKDVTEAQRALGIALDISAATGKSLDVVANGLGKAYDGNAASLGRLGLGLDKATLKGADMVEITQQLTESFGGQASAQANTLGGSIRGVQLAWDELFESFGTGVVGSSADDVQQLQDIEAKLRSMQPTAQRAGESVRDIGFSALTMWDRIVGVNDVLERGDWGNFWEMMEAGATGNDRYFASLVNTTQDVGGALDGMVYAAYNAKTTLGDYTTAAEDATDANDDQVASIKRLQAALSGMDKKQSILEQRFGLNQLIAGGPDKSGQRKGADGKVTRFTTAADRKEFAFSIASQGRDLANSLLGEGRRGAARNTLRDAREVIRSLGLPASFEENLLGTVRTPSALRPGDKVRPGTPQSGAAVAAINYNFYGGINVDSSAAAQQAAKEAKRLTALNRGAAAVLQ